jgi:hypothetical protein
MFASDRFALNLHIVQGISEFACMQSSSLSPSSALPPRRIIRHRTIVKLDQRLDPVTVSTSRTHLRIVHSAGAPMCTGVVLVRMLQPYDTLDQV